jgi:peptide/nickel transport system permease protein
MHPLLRTVLQRLGLGLITLFVVSLIIFSAISFLPGDFAKAILGQAATPETVEAFQKEIGLDKPAPERYINWISAILQGDFGSSFSSRVGFRRTVLDIITPRLWNTLFLAGITAIIAIPLALALGLLAALYRNSFFDRAVNALTLTTISFPEFFVAYILMLLLAVKLPILIKAVFGVSLQIFPSLSNVSADMDLLTRLQRSALPVLTLTLVILAHMMRMTRAAIISLLASPYIEMARLKGVSPAQVILRHALPNAWAPIANVIAFNLAYLVVGAVVVETVFVYPGIGQAMVDAVRSRDIPVVQACALVFAVTYILLNLLADIISIATNPRLLHPR